MPDLRRAEIGLRELEAHYRDVQDIEFTIEDGRALDAANPRRQAHRRPRPSASPSTWWKEGSSASEEAVLRVDAGGSTSCCIPRSIRPRRRPCIATGLPASPRVPRPARSCSTPTRPRPLKAKGRQVILVRVETTPRTSTACTPRPASSPPRRHDEPRRRGGARHGPALRGRRRRLASTTRPASMTVAGKTRHRRRHHDRRQLGQATRAAVRPCDQPRLYRRLRHAHDVGRRAAAARRARQRRHPADAAQAREFGAEGIGLCRTEHMFFDEERILRVREMICADDESARRARSQAICPCSADFDRACSRSWPACR